jgi:hypothetical protein
MLETETSFQSRKLKPVSVVVLVPPEAFGSPEENRYSGENRNIAIREKIAIWKKIARNRTVSKIACSQTIIFILITNRK